MNPGQLNKRIVVQRYKDYEDDHGVSKQGWVDLKTVWGSINNLHGKEYWAAKQYNAENTIEIVIRYSSCNDLSLKDRIKYNNRIFNITFIDNVLYKNEVLKLKVVEVI